MRKIGGDSQRVDDVVQGKFGDQGAVFEQQRQRLADSTAGAGDSNFDIVL